jgi:hypothetical protein
MEFIRIAERHTWPNIAHVRSQVCHCASYARNALGRDATLH